MVGAPADPATEEPVSADACPDGEEHAPPLRMAPEDDGRSDEAIAAKLPTSLGEIVTGLTLVVIGLVFPVLGAVVAAVALVYWLHVLRSDGTRLRRWLAIGGLTLACVGVVVQLVVLFFWLGNVRQAKQMALRARCEKQLRGLGQAMAMYAADLGSYPSLGDHHRYGADPDPGEDLQGLHAQADSNLQAYWLLIYKGYLRLNHFRCPGDDFWRRGQRSRSRRYGFAGWHESSYAFQPATRHADNRAFPGAKGQDGHFVLAGDKGARGSGEALSLNHAEGGNYLRLDQAVQFHDRPDAKVGWHENNVYLADVEPDGAVVDGRDRHLPAHPNDSKLLWNPRRRRQAEPVAAAR
ncbi:MAG: hypothetical protein ACOC93_00960 [Planctomycetota bacterium]